MMMTPDYVVPSFASHNSRGFTLLEMVIAIAIFSVVGIVSYVTLDQFFRTRVVLAEKNSELRRLQQTFLAFDRDVRYMQDRPVRDGLGETLPAMLPYTDGVTVDGPLIEMTVSSPHPHNQQLQRIHRVLWQLRDNVLMRNTWLVLDRDFDSLPVERKLIDKVASVEINYIKAREDQRGVEYTSYWEDEGRIPLGVELIITLSSEEIYRRILEVGSASG